eukprot:2037995-Alexandrium_andersonii.AAC.1
MRPLAEARGPGSLVSPRTSAIEACLKPRSSPGASSTRGGRVDSKRPEGPQKNRVADSGSETE